MAAPGRSSSSQPPGNMFQPPLWARAWLGQVVRPGVCAPRQLGCPSMSDAGGRWEGVPLGGHCALGAQTVPASAGSGHSSPFPPSLPFRATHSLGLSGPGQSMQTRMRVLAFWGPSGRGTEASCLAETGPGGF